jgi:hypothetical protein
MIKQIPDEEQKKAELAKLMNEGMTVLDWLQSMEKVALSD